MCHVLWDSCTERGQETGQDAWIYDHIDLLTLLHSDTLEDAIFFTEQLRYYADFQVTGGGFFFIQRL